VSSSHDELNTADQLTITDAERLWGASVQIGDSPGASIKGAGLGNAAELGMVVEDADPPSMLPENRPRWRADVLSGRVSEAGPGAAESAGQRKPSFLLRARQVDFPGSTTGEPGDFEVTDRLGEGGMGIVLRARQVCADRDVAVKMIRPDVAEHGAAWVSFLSEAMVTADLDHPNIVPIHDIGTTQDGFLFYAMKEVHGTCWKDVIGSNSESENLEILLKVCDAVAFAHAKGVVHRDVKPENVMLGDYGEVLVMDWGLAVGIDAGGKAQHLAQDSGRAGTPAYMAPEMARCESAKIGPASDVYLLGGILYEIVTGLRPHHADNIFACIYQAMENEIQGVDQSNPDPLEGERPREPFPSSRAHGELVEIALKAMATESTDRFESVKALQQAIRAYQSHAESVALAQRARAALERGNGSGNYDDFAQALFGFREALEAWTGNKSAARGVSKTGLAYATCAFRKQDLDLAMSPCST